MMQIEQWSLKIKWLLSKKEMFRSKADFETCHRDTWSADWFRAQEEIDAEIEELMNMRIE